MRGLRALVVLVAALSVTTAGVSEAHGACSTAVHPLGTQRVAYAGYATHGAVAYRTPGGAELARFGARNVNEYPTVFAVRAWTRGRDCRARWYRVQLPIRPNGSTGWVRAGSLALERVTTRIVVDLSERRLRLYRGGRLVLHAPVGIGAPVTPTPTGSYYVNQRLVPEDALGPFGPAALGISAFSPTLTWWLQGGPIAIHGTDEPSSIGRAASNGCIRLRNAILRRVFAATDAGTPVLVRP